MKEALWLCACLAGAAALHGADDGIFRYDFGSKTSPLREGYVQVTPLKGQGYSWSTSAKLKAVENTILESQANKRRQSIEPPPVYFNTLSCDHVSGAGDALLKLKVPAGAYRAVMICGHAGRCKPGFVWNIQTGGEEINNLGRFAIRELIFPVEAGADGAVISLKTKSSWLVNALLLVPEKKWKEFRKSDEYRSLRNEMFLLSDERLAKWKKIPQPIIRPAAEPAWTEQQKNQGFALFRRGYCDPVFPGEFPRKEEIDAPLRLFAAGNELESITFTVHALKDIDSVKLETSPLSGPRGAKLAAPGIRYVRYMMVRPHYTILDRYFEAPDIVMPYRKPLELEKGRNLTFWLTVKVPAGTPAGTYTGQVRLSCGKVTRNLPFTVKILPFDLEKDPDRIYAIYYRMPDPDASNDSPHSARWLTNKRESELAGLRDAGFTGITMNFWATRRKGKELSVEMNRYRKGAEALNRYGITAPVPAGYGEGRLYADNMHKGLPPHLTGMEMPNDAYFADVEKTIQTIMAEYKKNPSWPEPLIYLTDEPDCTPTVVAYLKRVGEIAKRCGARTYVTANPASKLFAPLFDVVDVWCPPSFALPPEAMKEWQKKRPGTEFWCYPNSVCGSNNHVTFAGARMTFGFGFWKSEFKALIPWMYQSIGGDQWNYLDAARMDFLNRTDDDGTPIPAMNFLCYREGIDDVRYLRTLRTRIDLAKRNGLAAAAARGEKLIGELREAIPAQRRYKDHEDGVWDCGTMDAWRWRIAQEIMNINTELQKKGVRK